jgi:glycosyltransferase involved in cell wall biosynthesis
MRRVLVIGTIWPYHSGGARVPGLAKYLPECGWEPVVLTQPLPRDANLPYRVETVGGDHVGSHVVRGLHLDGEGGPRRQLARTLHISSENALLKWGFRLIREVLEYPDGNRAWRRSALRRALELVRDEHFDAVISTSPPVSSHLIAAKLKRRYGLMWVADFPHLWSQNQGIRYGCVRRWMDRRLEKKTLESADALTTTNCAYAQRFGSLHVSREIATIQHGYDPEYANRHPDDVSSRFTLVHTGSFSPGIREPRMLLDALQALLQRGAIGRQQLEVHLYGPAYDWVDEQVRDRGLADVVSQQGWVLGEAAHRVQRRSQVLLLPKFEAAAGEGMLNSKVFDYLAAMRPILAFGAHSDAADEIIAATGAGVTVESVGTLAAALEKMYTEYSTKGAVSYKGSYDKIQAYSQVVMAQRFADLLLELTLSRQSVEE